MIRVVIPSKCGIIQSRLLHFFLLFHIVSVAQVNPLQPLIGKHQIGFSQLQQNISVKGRGNIICTIDIWYPEAKNRSERYTYKDYILLNPDSTIEWSLHSTRKNIESFFGSTTDSAWEALIYRETLAYKKSQPPREKLPLILGMLRPFSTINTCELLASQGYVVAMIHQVDDFSPDDSSRWNLQMRTELILYDGVINRLSESNIIDKTKVGLLGFSGSGFSQFLYAMQSTTPKCIALLESGLYAEGLFDALIHSGLYRPQNLKIPFLYFHNGYMDAKEPYRHEFNKIPKNKRIKTLYMDSTMHHWDYASEGFLSSAYLNNRKPEVAIRQLKNYLNVNARLIDFFNEQLEYKKSKLRFKVPAGSEVD